MPLSFRGSGFCAQKPEPRKGNHKGLPLPSMTAQRGNPLRLPSLKSEGLMAVRLAPGAIDIQPGVVKIR